MYFYTFDHINGNQFFHFYVIFPYGMFCTRNQSVPLILKCDYQVDLLFWKLKAAIVNIFYNSNGPNECVLRKALLIVFML